MNPPNILLRFLYSFVVCFKYVFNASFAAWVMKGWNGPPPLPPAEPPKKLEAKPPETPKPPAKPSQASALQLLGILQREGRLVDFLQEDIAGFSDSEVGAAVRVVHEGCRKVLSEYVSLQPLRTDGEGARVVVEKGFDASAIRLTGNVTGQPPFTGSLRHHGWRAAAVRLPDPPPEAEAAIVAPAEVEL